MSYSTRVMRPEDWAGIKHFAPDEFAHPDKMGYEFMHWLDGVRGRAGVPMFATSGYRPPARNEAVGGAKDSAHMDVPCDAVDIGMRPRADDPNWNTTRFKIIEAAIALGCQRIGTYANGSLHLDRTEHKRPAPRMWRLVGAERKD
jgi:uncharacterized protein YcbK (DUF882 family)